MSKPYKFVRIAIYSSLIAVVSGIASLWTGAMTEHSRNAPILPGVETASADFPAVAADGGGDSDGGDDGDCGAGDCGGY